MSGLGITDVMTVFVFMGICLMFVMVWISKSEEKKSTLKEEIKKLKARIDSYEREKFMLLENMEDAAAQPKIETVSDVAEMPTTDRGNVTVLAQALEQNADFEKENKKLKAELEEARTAMEEIYKALVEKGDNKRKK